MRWVKIKGSKGSYELARNKFTKAGFCFGGKHSHYVRGAKTVTEASMGLYHKEALGFLRSQFYKSPDRKIVILACSNCPKVSYIEVHE